MSERNYYVLCDDNCRFPAMTAEQIMEAIEEATGNVPEHVDDAFITKIKESNHNANLTFWKGTQAEFNALGVTATAFQVGIDANGKLYFTPVPADPIDGSTIQDGTITNDKLATDAMRLVFSNVSVSPSQFAAGGSFEDYQYRGTILFSGAGDLTNMTPEIILNVTEAISGNFAPVAQSFNGGVYIFAAEIPEAAFTIPTIIFWR